MAVTHFHEPWFLLKIIVHNCIITSPFLHTKFKWINFSVLRKWNVIGNLLALRVTYKFLQSTYAIIFLCYFVPMKHLQYHFFTSIYLCKYLCYNILWHNGLFLWVVKWNSCTCYYSEPTAANLAEIMYSKQFYLSFKSSTWSFK